MVIIQDNTQPSGVYIPSIDGKDLMISNNLLLHDNEFGYTLLRKDGAPNLRRFINTLDYSLDLIKLREIYRKVYRNNYFSFFFKEKEYTSEVINVTFKYSNKLYNPIKQDYYIHHSYRLDDLTFNDCLAYSSTGEILGVHVNTDLKSPLSPSILEALKPSFKVVNNQIVTSYIPTIDSRKQIREKLYKDGFYCNGTHYVRFKRSSGSARVGKCLFIDEKLYKRMHKWDMCGLKVKHGDPIDLAALESYISLTSSSIIDTLTIDPKSILVIDDYESVFKDKVAATKIVDSSLHTEESEEMISNSIWDGQSLMDVSLFSNYSQYGMLLLRNRFFKSCCFNTNIQDFFKDNGIESISQLNGFTLANSVSEIKMITTPSSIKYLKFGKLEDWLNTIDSTFGIVMHDKPTHYMGGDMVHTHYQLLNTLQLSKEETEEFLKPQLEYIKLIQSNPAVLRFHIKYPLNSPVTFNPDQDMNDIVYTLLGINDNFAQTEMYSKFVKTITTSMRNNMKCGHVMVNGNYSTLLGNPYEMLLASIGQFDGTSLLGTGNIHSTRFEYGIDLLGSRSPHVAAGNILVTHNIECEVLDKYFNLSKQIVCINSIGENMLQRLSGAD